MKKTLMTTIALILLTHATAHAQSLSAGVNDFLDSGDRAYLPVANSRGGDDYYRQSYELWFQAGESVVASLEAPTQDSSDPRYWDTYLLVVDPMGNLDWNDDGGDGYNSRLQFTAAYSGNYTFFVTSYRSNTGGSYWFTVSHSATGPTPTPPAPTGDRGIGFGQTLAGALATGDRATLPGDQQHSGTNYFRDGFAFTVTQDHINRFGSGVTVDLGSSFDGYLYLVSPWGEVVTWNDDFGSTSASRMTWVTSPGTWRVVVSSYYPGTGGGYSVTLAAGF